MPERLVALVAAFILPLAAEPAAAQAVLAQPPSVAAAPFERVTFQQAVSRAIEHHPSVGEAAQAILRAQALLDQSKSVFRPSLYAGVTGVMLDAARGFNGFETVPRSQAAFSATLGYPILDTAGWAAKNQAADQVAIARISAEETRRQVAITAAETYLAVIAAQRQREIALRNLDTAGALEQYAKARLDAGKGSRLNHVRSTQERGTAELQLEIAELLVRQAQEALGVAVFADAPLDASGDPELKPAAPPTSEAWLMERPDVRLFSAQLQASDRVVRDAWTAWFPTANVYFTPQYVNPKGGFEPANTWRAGFQLQIPVYDSTLGPAKRVKVTERETARFRFDNVKVEAKAELRLAEETVTRREQMVESSRVSSESAAEALRISQIAYEAGATSNIEVVQAQQAARNTEIALAVSEDRLRQSRLDLLVSLGQFP
jgi:outer membrane protein